MGAFSPFSLFTPNDDLLLSNAIQSGASLESLAKGAVQFSRKYSLGELHDRWYTLLFGSDKPKPSESMIDFEQSAPALPSKFCKFGNSKEQKIVSFKRKSKSVRNCYYAMRKRLRKDMETSMDFDFLVDPENGNCVVNGFEPLPRNCEPEGPSFNHFSNLDPPHNSLPENTMDVDVAINEVAGQEFYARVNETVQANIPINLTNIPSEEPQIIEGNMPLNGAAEVLDVPIELGIDSFIRDNNLEEVSLPGFPQTNNDPANLVSEFDEYIIDSPELEGGDSLDDLQLSLLLDVPNIPLWPTEKHGDIPCHGSNDSIACDDGYLEKLSNSLLNFTGDEELYLTNSVDKDGLGNSYYDGLSSLLLPYPVDGSSDQIPETDETQLLLTPPKDIKNTSISCHAEVDNTAGKAETELLVASDAHLTNPSVSCCADVDDNRVFVSQSNGVEGVHKSEFQMTTSGLANDPHFPELNNGVVLCTINTEDPEVPSNDDVFLPFNDPTPTISYSPESVARRSNQSVPPEKNSIGAHVSSQTTRDCGLPRPFCGSKIQCDMSYNHASHTLSRSVVTASGGLGGNNNATNTPHVPLLVNPKEKPDNVSYVKHPSSNVTNFPRETPALGNGFRNHVQSNGSTLKPEQDATLPLADNQMQHAEVASSAILESTQMAQMIDDDDDEEEYIESDEDVPYYSDVEAMVLEMELDHYDHKFYENEEVSRYQHEETKRTIIRLEQGARSYIQRAMASHGALALLYGRHSTYYIKKTEVVLGRATDGVDIDLGKVGGVKSISRRQAIIKMDNDGLFYIENIGRSLVLVNNKVLHRGQSQRLHSSYLIELRGMPFMFEINQRMKR